MARILVDTATMEVTEQIASQDYDCDAMCDVPIAEDTLYIRVAYLAERDQIKRDRPSAKHIEKLHPSCWEKVAT